MNCESSAEDDMNTLSVSVALSMGVSSLSHVTDVFTKLARLGSKVTLQVKVTAAPVSLDVFDEVIITDGAGTANKQWSDIKINVCSMYKTRT